MKKESVFRKSSGKWYWKPNTKSPNEYGPYNSREDARIGRKKYLHGVISDEAKPEAEQQQTAALS